MLSLRMRSKLFMKDYLQRDKNMKLIKDLQGRVITTVFGGCPICGGKNTLTNVGSTLKPCLECSAYRSKFEQCSFGSSKYKLVEGSSEHLGKELTLKEWAKMTRDMRREIEMAEGKGETQEQTKAEGISEKPKETLNAKNIVIVFLGLLFVIGAIFAIFSGRPGLALAYWTMLWGVMYWIVIGLLKGTRWLKKTF